jgi:antitoxin component YwqK of YwqJK toxin-antitoxin module
MKNILFLAIPFLCACSYYKQVNRFNNNGNKTGVWVSIGDSICRTNFNNSSTCDKTVQIVHYCNGVLNGRIEISDKNGYKILDGSYLRGKKHGIWTAYDKKGNILSSYTYCRDTITRCIIKNTDW